MNDLQRSKCHSSNTPRHLPALLGDGTISVWHFRGQIQAQIASYSIGNELAGHRHTFRHTIISLALTRGVPEATVRKWVGHVDEVIIRRYTHIASQESHAAMQRLEESVKARRLQAG